MKKILIVLMMFLSVSVFASMTVFLTGEQTSGMNKYCKYSDGSIITVGSHQLCPLSIKR